MAVVSAYLSKKEKGVYVVTAYMTKKAGAAQTANAAKTATRVTSETKNVQTPTKDNIPFSSDAVNAAERTEQGAIRNKETTQSGGTMKNKGLQSGGGRGIMRTGSVSGALTPDSRRASKHAEQYYEAVRHMKTDIQRIARNTGFSEKEIADIKSFVFEEEHDLGDSGIRRFHESYEMAQSWQRLIDVKEY